MCSSHRPLLALPPTATQQESRSAAAAAAAAIARGGHAHEGTSDIEAPLLGDRQAAYAPEGPANGSAPGLPGSPLGGKAKSDTGSVRGGAQHAQRRDPKKLWALVRNTLGGSKSWSRSWALAVLVLVRPAVTRHEQRTALHMQRPMYRTQHLLSWFGMCRPDPAAS